MSLNYYPNNTVGHKIIEIQNQRWNQVQTHDSNELL